MTPRRLLVGLVCLVSLSLASPVAGQSPEAEVEAAVHRLFDAMRSGDGDAAGALFHPQARLHSVGEQNGRPVLVTGDPGAFVQAIGSPRDEVWDERIWDLEVEVDGNLATAWMNYAFFLDDRLSHCGVNAFQWVRTEGNWQILQITDTRRQVGCAVP